VRPVLQGQLGRLMYAVAAFELADVAATLLILLATQLLTPDNALVLFARMRTKGPRIEGAACTESD
jgi:hypothetical protein